MFGREIKQRPDVKVWVRIELLIESLILAQDERWRRA